MGSGEKNKRSLCHTKGNGFRFNFLPNIKTLNNSLHATVIFVILKSRFVSR